MASFYVLFPFFLLYSLHIDIIMKKYFITGIALCLGFVSFAQKAVDFKLNPEIGKTMNMLMQVKTDVEGPQSMIMDMNMKMVMTATEKQDENFKIETVTKAVKVDVDAGMMNMSYNSEEEPKDEMAKMMGSQFEKIIGQVITVILTPKGKTVEVILPEGIGQGMDKSSFASISTPLPENPVAVGATWQHSADMGENPFISKTETTSTFKEENENGYVIGVVGKLLDESANEIGSVTGSYVLDKKTLVTKNADVKTSIEVQGTKVISDVVLTVQ